VIFKTEDSKASRRRVRNPDLGVKGDRSVVGTGSGRIAVYPEIIPGQKSY